MTAEVKHEAYSTGPYGRVPTATLFTHGHCALFREHQLQLQRVFSRVHL